MNSRIRIHLVLLSCIVLGLLILLSIESLKVNNGLSSSIITFIAFIFFNILTSLMLKLKNDILSYWSIKKITLLPVFIIAGGLVSTTPLLVAIFLGKINFDSVYLNIESISIYSIITTLVIVSWEELWFRGIFLNYCCKQISIINLSLIIGLLFMLMHFFNPKTDLLNIGPTLFLAGALLTMTYFYFKTIWAPIGLHFGNNYFNELIKTKSETINVLYSQDGYITALILLILFSTLVITYKYRNNNTADSN